MQYSIDWVWNQAKSGALTKSRVLSQTEVFTLHQCRRLVPWAVLLANRVLAQSQPVQTEVRIDTEQADAVLAILGGADQWSRLWKTDGDARLKKRDPEMTGSTSGGRFATSRRGGAGSSRRMLLRMERLESPRKGLCPVIIS